jgi:hypothetical protein
MVLQVFLIGYVERVLIAFVEEVLLEQLLELHFFVH